MIGKEVGISNIDTYVNILLPLPFEHNYTYKLPDNINISKGSLVEVPLGNRCMWGVVIDYVDSKDISISANKIKYIKRSYEDFIVSESFLSFMTFFAAYTMTPLGLVLKMFLRGFNPDIFLDKETNCGWILDKTAYEKALVEKSIKITAQRQSIIDCLLSKDIVWDKHQLLKASGVTGSTLDSLAKSAIIIKKPFPFSEKISSDDGYKANLNEDQYYASNVLKQAIVQKNIETYLLEGVTGSGKTEVYFEAIEAAISSGEQSLILMPEIMLTQQFLDRFSQRFGFYPAQWHSRLSSVQRSRLWDNVSKGKIRVVVGARSALFLPFKNLRVLVVDEEHDQSYKQEENVIYNARDMAVALGHKQGFVVILASATPSIETIVNVERGKYKHLMLPKRVFDSQLPQLSIIDLKEHGGERGNFLSPILIEEMAKALERGEQSMLFLNRRGYSPLTICKGCGHKLGCPHCSTWLVQHKYKNIYSCHYCGYQETFSKDCPSCLSSDSLFAYGPGVERIAEEVTRNFPQARVLILSTDFQGTLTQIRSELELITAGKVDIIVGTQLVAKGHNFPLMSLVGVVDADMGLNIKDFRASERCLQLLLQVTGRAGRSGLVSKGYLQSYDTNGPVVKALASGEFQTFYKQEIAIRKQHSLPPFGKIVALIVSSEDMNKALDYARKLRQVAAQTKDLIFLGPAEAPIFCLRDRYRYRLMLHSTLSFPIQKYIRELLCSASNPPAGVEVQVDVDPYSFS